MSLLRVCVVINVERFAHGAIHEIQGSARGFLVSVSMCHIESQGLAQPVVSNAARHFVGSTVVGAWTESPYMR